MSEEKAQHWTQLRTDTVHSTLLQLAITFIHFHTHSLTLIFVLSCKKLRTLAISILTVMGSNNNNNNASSSEFFYQRHVFLCYKNPAVWPPRIEAAEFDRLPRLLHAAIIARKPNINKEVKTLLFLSSFLLSFVFFL